mmetsp:Transcript_31811/g.38471  ORF Transcript_31811/g.38471 Transcript_31811/m.38471 type:complete len:115 (-) Transcript_31811:879-1223(-)|eukprot:CAMPEP_0197853024 /NCGR_PEP_ID=MMETSP1438-20131217/21943_1 /TAXON_ID=1461541 /ORGANISM="Pterosperma sp., Strain CCMP1384" /LENGTH=114 /DNA_ID=CAMNT_0043467287 /DNA_START=113 /DNA_END=457 /DNA_ORIENTATION=-
MADGSDPEGFRKRVDEIVDKADKTTDPEVRAAMIADVSAICKEGVAVVKALEEKLQNTKVSGCCGSKADPDVTKELDLVEITKGKANRLLMKLKHEADPTLEQKENRRSRMSTI